MEILVWKILAFGLAGVSALLLRALLYANSYMDQLEDEKEEFFNKARFYELIYQETRFKYNEEKNKAKGGRSKNAG